jgi:DnaJ homolog subfamily C member 19
MTPLIIGLVVLVVLLLLAAVYSRAKPRELIKGMRFSGGVLLGLVTVALAITGRVGLAFLAAAGAWALLTGTTPPWMRFPQGGRDSGGSRDIPQGRRGAMSRAEALKVLGLEEGATEEQIRAAHRRLIVQIHPDKGGTSYLAAKINEAKDVLLRG